MAAFAVPGVLEAEVPCGKHVLGGIASATLQILLSPFPEAGKLLPSPVLAQITVNFTTR